MATSRAATRITVGHWWIMMLSIRRSMMIMEEEGAAMDKEIMIMTIPKEHDRYYNSYCDDNFVIVFLVMVILNTNTKHEDRNDADHCRINSSDAPRQDAAPSKTLPFRVWERHGFRFHQCPSFQTNCIPNTWLRCASVNMPSRVVIPILSPSEMEIPITQCRKNETTTCHGAGSPSMPRRASSECSNTITIRIDISKIGSARDQRVKQLTCVWEVRCLDSIDLPDTQLLKSLFNRRCVQQRLQAYQGNDFAR